MRERGRKTRARAFSPRVVATKRRRYLSAAYKLAVKRERERARGRAGALLEAHLSAETRNLRKARQLD